VTTPDPAAVDAALEQLYARVPALDCKGLCYSSCGIIECSERERERMAAAGVVLPPLDEQWAAADTSDRRANCPALSLFGSCAVYSVRPMICRLWGATAGMPCVYGCKPIAGPLLTEGEGWDLLGQSIEVGGPPARLAGFTAAQLRRWVRTNPEVAAELLARGQSQDQRRRFRRG
jgi:hypothetical protein